jgi:hypothetical protein
MAKGNRRQGPQKGRVKGSTRATRTQHYYSGQTPGQRYTTIIKEVGLTPRRPTYGLDVTITNPLPGGSMQAANWQASGGSSGASSITVTLDPPGSTLSVQGGLNQPLPSWRWQFMVASQPGTYTLTAQVYDQYGNTVSETITVTVP